MVSRQAVAGPKVAQAQSATVTDLLVLLLLLLLHAEKTKETDFTVCKVQNPISPTGLFSTRKFIKSSLSPISLIPRDVLQLMLNLRLHADDN